MKAMLRTLLILCGLLLAAAPVWGQAPAAVLTADQSRAEIHVVRGAPGGRSWLALTIRPDAGWHTYWKNPGDSGAAPYVDWDGIETASPLYPPPERLPVAGLMTYGYEGTATLLFPVDGPLPERTTVFAEWLVCEEICLPQVVEQEIALTGGGDSIVAEARAALPQPSLWPADLMVGEEQLALTLYADTADIADVKEAYFFPENGMLIDHAAMQQADLTDQGFRLTLTRAPGAEPGAQESGVLRVERLDGSVEAWRLDAQTAGALSAGPHPAPEPSPAGASAAGSGPSIGRALLLAVLGGLILNLMPCVFPVLSLKALALVRSSGLDERAVRLDGLAYTAGVVLSFLAIAAVLLILKAAGSQVGWGFQFQNPWFLTFMAVLLFAVGLNLAGWFEVSGRFAGVGQTLAAKDGPAGAFFTGVLATVAATPCTAPFMATALAVALAQPAAIGLSIFAMLGFGLALPFLLISFLPGLRKLLPRPGAWMEVFKQAMAFPLFLFVVWLLWNLTLVGGPNRLALAMSMMTLLAFTIWLGRLNLTGRAARGAGAAVLIAGLAGLSYLASQASGAGPAAGTPLAQRPGAAEKIAFDPDRLAALRAEGEPVFLYFTAAWCINCKVNERVALNTDRVQDFFKQQGITLMVGDWTRPDPAIAAALERYNQPGIPVYLFFPPDGEPVILPRILEPGLVVHLLSKELPARV